LNFPWEYVGFAGSKNAMAEMCGRPFVHGNPQQRFLSNSPVLTAALKELSGVLHYGDRIVCNLSSNVAYDITTA
jgi:hypothetical protein